MSDPIVEIEVELRRPIVTQEQANVHRKKLGDSFDKLSQEQAAALLAEIFELKTRVHHDFRRLSRGVRLELLLKLTKQLSTQASENFRTSLNETKDTPIKKSMREIFPDYTKIQRDTFLNSLVKAPTGLPMVKLVFRNSGPFSDDNSAPIVRNPDKSKNLPNLLGPVPGTAKNQMEIQGVVTGHRPDAEYKFGRTIETKTWKLVGTNWTFLEEPTAAGADDNSHRSDEDFHPDNNHIYSVDSPGFRPELFGSLPAGTTEVVFMMNATETVEVKVGNAASLPVATLDWFSVTWLEKVHGKWRRKPGFNKIAVGSIDNLDGAGEPPTMF